MAERTDLRLKDTEDIGLDEAFQNWLSTTVDTINSDLDVIESNLNTLLAAVPLATIQLTRCDTSATSNITLSQDFKGFIEKLINKIESLETRLESLGG